MACYIIDDHGEPMAEPNVQKWTEWFEKADTQVAVSKIGDIRISTVFLGVDHNFDGFGPPVLYETMIFGGAFGNYQQRYANKEEAVVGHYKAVALVNGQRDNERI